MIFVKVLLIISIILTNVLATINNSCQGFCISEQWYDDYKCIIETYSYSEYYCNLLDELYNRLDLDKSDFCATQSESYKYSIKQLYNKYPKILMKCRCLLL